MSPTITISANSEQFELKSRNQLVTLIDRILLNDFNEIWITGHGETSLCALTNLNSAFLMYLRNDGDHGFRSNNKQGDENRTEEFKLSNGQADKYPEAWLTQRGTIRSALLTYFDSGMMEQSIEWSEEI